MIKFGTSGHRGVIGEGFTRRHVWAVGRATFDVLGLARPRILIGYDSREGNSVRLDKGSFTEALVRTLIGLGGEVYFCDSPTPTPVVSWMIETNGFDGGFILTASHNPPEYNGLKFNPKNGAPASVGVTDELTRRANDYFASAEDETVYLSGAQVDSGFFLVDGPKKFVADLVQKVRNILSSGFSGSMVADVSHGACGRTWKLLGEELGIEIDVLRGEPRSDFGGIIPNPTDSERIRELGDSVLKTGAVLGVGNDPDGDRHVLVDETGKFVSPEIVTCIILTHFCEYGLDVFGVASTLASSGIVRKVCEGLGIRYEETGVGFKYFTGFLESARESGKIGLACESSGGFSTSFHTLEKCGFLPVVLILRIMNRSGKRLSELAGETVGAYGDLVFEERAVSGNVDLEALKKASVIHPRGAFLREVLDFDGVKFCFENGDWVLVRPSGTEPLVRVYAESNDMGVSGELLDIIEGVIRNG